MTALHCNEQRNNKGTTKSSRGRRPKPNYQRGKDGNQSSCMNGQPIVQVALHHQKSSIEQQQQQQQQLPVEVFCVANHSTCKKHSLVVATVVAIAAAAVTFIPSSVAFSPASTSSSSRSPIATTNHQTSSSFGICASTLVPPHPDNRNQHLEFLLDYLGLVSTNSKLSNSHHHKDIHRQRQSTNNDFVNPKSEWQLPVLQYRSSSTYGSLAFALPDFATCLPNPTSESTRDSTPIVRLPLVSSLTLNRLRFKNQDTSTASHGEITIGTRFPSLATRTAVSAATNIDVSPMKTAVSTSYASVASETEVSPEEVLNRQRKEQWAAKYTSVDALRKTFGTNRNGIWGDLDPQTTRRLYKTLLPRALLELHCTALNSCPTPNSSSPSTSSVSPVVAQDDGQSPLLLLHPEDLAPLAYEARVAAKLYARERSVLPARIAANLIDGFRQWKKYGQFHCHGMSYQQLWDKYASVILHDVHKNQYDLTVEDVTAKICLKILERSCQTNPTVDQLVNCPQEDYCSSSSVSGEATSTGLSATRTDRESNRHVNPNDYYYDRADDDDIVEDLKFITAQLEADARNLLRPIDHANDGNPFMFVEDRQLTIMSPLTASRKKVKKRTILVPSTVTSTGYASRRTYSTVRAATAAASTATTNEFQQHKVRLLRSMLRLKRKFERFQCRQIQEQRNQQQVQDQESAK